MNSFTNISTSVFHASMGQTVSFDNNLVCYQCYGTSYMIGSPLHNVNLPHRSDAE